MAGHGTGTYDPCVTGAMLVYSALLINSWRYGIRVRGSESLGVVYRRCIGSIKTTRTITIVISWDGQRVLQAG
jgi:hypothetical protein